MQTQLTSLQAKLKAVQKRIKTQVTIDAISPLMDKLYAQEEKLERKIDSIISSSTAKSTLPNKFTKKLKIKLEKISPMSLKHGKRRPGTISYIMIDFPAKGDKYYTADVAPLVREIKTLLKNHNL